MSARYVVSVEVRARIERWHSHARRIAAAGYLPQATPEGCARQVAMLDSGELPVLPPPSAVVRRAVENDERQMDELYAGRFESQDAEDAEVEWNRREYRETARQRRDERDRIAGPESLKFTEET